MRTNLKLYVWEDVLHDYTAGIAFAYAESIEEARKLVWESLGYKSDDILREPREVTTKEGFGMSGGG